MKSYLKNNYNHTIKQAFETTRPHEQMFSPLDLVKYHPFSPHSQGFTCSCDANRRFLQSAGDRKNTREETVSLFFFR